MASLGSMLSACADMLRDAAGTCVEYHTHPNRSWEYHVYISGIAEGLEQGVVRPIPLAAAWYMLAERHWIEKRNAAACPLARRYV